MTIKIGDICHLKNYQDNFWIGKVFEIHKKIDDYEFLNPILYVIIINEKIPRLDIIHENKLELRNNEWWEK